MRKVIIFINLLLLSLGCGQKRDLKKFIKENPKLIKLNCNWILQYKAKGKDYRDYYFEGNVADTTYRLNFARCGNNKFELHYLSRFHLKGDTVYRLSLSVELDTLFYLKEPFDGNTYLNPRKKEGRVFYKGKDYFKARFGLD